MDLASVIIKTKVDWLTVTKQPERQPEGYVDFNSWLVWCRDDAVRGLHGLETDFILMDAQPRFYMAELLCRKTGLRLSIPHQTSTQGLRLVMTGSATIANTEEFLKDLQGAGWKPTRIDLAWDIFHYDVTVNQIASYWWGAFGREGKVRSQLISSANGATFSIGSRSSQKYIRIYDKAKEQDKAFSWMRIELELKGDWAKWGIATAQTSVWGATSTLLDIINLPEHDLTFLLWDSAIGYEQQPAIEIPRTIGNREAWMRSQVQSAFEKMCYEQPEIAKEILLDWQAIYNLYQS